MRLVRWTTTFICALSFFVAAGATAGAATVRQPGVRDRGAGAVTAAAASVGDLAISNVEPEGWTDVFSLTVTCTNPANGYVLEVTGTATVTQAGIPAGSECTVSNIAVAGHGHWWKPVIVPSDPVAIVEGQTATITVTNRPSPGYITIKVTAPTGRTDRFLFTAKCTNPDGVFTLDVVGTGEGTLRLIPPTSVCNLTETAPAGYAAPVFDPAGPIDFRADRSIVVRVTNTLLVPAPIQAHRTPPVLPVVAGRRLPTTGSPVAPASVLGVLFVLAGALLLAFARLVSSREEAPVAEVVGTVTGVVRRWPDRNELPTSSAGTPRRDRAGPTSEADRRGGRGLSPPSGFTP